MKRTALLLSLATALSLGLTARPADAVIGVTDKVPAATLLLPYFEVNLNSSSAETTLMSINNASATAILAHVTLWSDLGVPTFAFNSYLTGYDVLTINLRDIFNGTVPRTASDGQDPTDTISRQGQFSQDINFASCTGQLPPPPIPAALVDHLIKSHTGQASPVYGNRCSGNPYGDNIARGYVTVETVNNCTLRVASDPGYFGSGGSGDATNQNVMWGDYFYVDSANNFAQGDSLVSIEASATNPETSVPGEYTFYGRYVAWTAADNREPLAATSLARYLNGGSFTGGTDLIVWRDSKVNQGPFTCPYAPGVRPPWAPLSHEDILIFDEQENPEISAGTNPFAFATQRVAVDGPALPITPNFGYAYLNLNHGTVTAGSNPPEDPIAAQSYVSNVMKASGRFSVGQPALVLEHAAQILAHQCLSSTGAPGACTLN